MPEPNDQGLQPDGISPEPSKDIEGNNPAPSQDDTGQVADQVTDQIPDQDDRGVPAENVLGEMRRKIDKVMGEFEEFKLNQSYQQSQNIQQQQPYQPPQQTYQQPQQQPQRIVPRTPDEIADIVDREMQEKYGEAFQNGTANYFEMQRFQNKRTAELTSAMMSTSNSLQAERQNSFGRVVNLYPDLNNVNSNLARGVFNEINRRANVMGVNPQSYLERDPYAFESITPFVASQMGIGAKVQNGVKVQARPNNMPPSNFPGQETPKPKEIKPTQADVNLEKRFGVKAKTLATMREKSPGSSVFVDESNILIS
jgi:hypothetical protein